MVPRWSGDARRWCSALVLAAPQVLPLPPAGQGRLDDPGGAGFEVMSATAELREESFPLQLAPELLEGALHTVALMELDVCHGTSEESAAGPPDGAPAAFDRDERAGPASR